MTLQLLFGIEHICQINFIDTGSLWIEQGNNPLPIGGPLAQRQTIMLLSV